MKTAYRIRPAAASDIEDIVALDRSIQNVPHWGSADYLGALASEGGGPGTSRLKTAGLRRCLFVALREERLAGFAVGRVTVIEQDVLAELESVGVADSARRAGIGRALCEAVIAWVREEGADELDLEVRSASDGAIALYRGLGFATFGMRAKYYRDPPDDAVLMRLGMV